MKSIYNFINEKITLNTQSKLWSIEDAKYGDIVTMTVYSNDNVFYVFIFKGIENNKVRFEAVYTSSNKGIYICWHQDEYIGDPLNKKSAEDYKFYLSTKEEQQIFFDAMKKAGYKFNKAKKEIEDI